MPVHQGLKMPEELTGEANLLGQQISAGLHSAELIYAAATYRTATLMALICV